MPHGRETARYRGKGDDFMSVHQPQDLHHAFTQAFNVGDIDAIMSLYESEAVLVPEPGQTVAGADAVRAALSGFLALKGTMTIETRRVVTAGDLALLHGHWTLKGTAPDGSAINMTGRDTEVARRQPDGTWLYVIDNPFSDE
jgi:uncharacterized protein (TIGR02246 family)